MDPERFFDQVARTLAQPIPRRRAVRLVGAALLTAAVPGLSPRTALASGAQTCGADQSLCPWDHDNDFRTPNEYYCCGPPTWRFVCGPYTGAGSGRCRDTCAPDTTRYPCPKDCCSRLFSEGCNPDGTCKDKTANRCGGATCRSGERCCPPTKKMARAHCFDPSKECCTPVAGVVPKWPIRDLDNCPNRVARKNHKPRANGCGPQNGIKVPDRPFAANFKPACDFHDICYETCGKKKAFCDRRFRSLMEDACDETFKPESLKHIACYAAAETYYQAVSRIGQEPYEDAQKEACLCC